MQPEQVRPRLNLIDDAGDEVAEVIKLACQDEHASNTLVALVGHDEAIAGLIPCDLLTPAQQQRIVEIVRRPTDDEQMCKAMLFAMNMIHARIGMVREVAEKLNDVEFWSEDEP